MEEKYFKNRNSKKSYSLNELINTGIIFKDDLIWKEGLTNWMPAYKIEELKDYVIERPPEKKVVILLRKIKRALLPSAVILIIFSILLGTAGGLFEKWQYTNFMAEVQPNIDKYLKKKEEKAELKREKALERKREKEQIEQNIASLRKNFEKRDKQLEELQKEAYNNFLNATISSDLDFYITLANNYINKRSKRLKEYKSERNRLESKLNNLKPRESNIINVVTYDVPLGTIATVNGNGDIFYRWSYYTAPEDDNEQLSYSKSHKFLFRPYKAFFNPVYFNHEELSNTMTLLWNFILSALVTNLMFFPIFIFGAIKYNDRKKK